MTALLAIFALLATTVQATPVNPQAAAMNDFQQRLQSYLTLRENLAMKIEPLKTTPSAADLQARQQALAAALRNARAGAKQGDLIPSPVQEQIRQAIKADFSRREAAARRAAIQEVPRGPLPGINKSYPEHAALPTVPPLLLANLPRLPDNLQYRFYGRYVVLLDGDVEIVADYIHNALPPVTK